MRLTELKVTSNCFCNWETTLPNKVTGINNSVNCYHVITRKFQSLVDLLGGVKIHRTIWSKLFLQIKWLGLGKESYLLISTTNGITFSKVYEETHTSRFLKVNIKYYHCIPSYISVWVSWWGLFCKVSCEWKKGFLWKSSLLSLPPSLPSKPSPPPFLSFLG